MALKKIILVTLVLGFVFSLIILSVQPTKADSNGMPPQDVIEAQQRACDANEIMMQYFFENGYVTDFPNYFGGSFIEDNILHIRLVSDMEESTALLKYKLAGYNDVIVYEYCDTSRNDLQKYADEVVAMLKADGMDITSWYVSSVTGDIVIEMLQEDIPAAEKTINQQQMYTLGNRSPNIVLKQGEYATLDAVAD